MVLEMKISAETVNRVERFLVTDSYRALAESTMSFNRRLNEERKMRIPYIDGQTGVAQKHYNNERKRRERMPARRNGQVCSYPQFRWRKKRYQYLQYFMQPKHLRVEPDAAGIDQKNVETVNKEQESTQGVEETDKRDDWPGFYEDDFAMQEEADEKAEESEGSDYEFDGTRVKKVKPRKNAKTKSTKLNPQLVKIKETSSAVKPPHPNKRRTHADNIPDSEKPFTCDLCSARYKTRPGLTYHFNHTHKKNPLDLEYTPSMLQEEGEETRSSESPSAISVAGSDSQDASSVGGSSLKIKSTDLYSITQIEDDIPSIQQPKGKPSSFTKLEKVKQKKNQTLSPITNLHPANKTSSGAPIAVPAPYCDFCLGDAKLNKKSLLPEELIGCAECGRSGHPTCLQFTGNMLISVKQYPWQCIECKTCTICGTSENDDQLLFCDDCDRGFHMYCLNPPMKVAPEGTWSCHICNEIFHTQN